MCSCEGGRKGSGSTEDREKRSEGSERAGEVPEERSARHGTNMSRDGKAPVAFEELE